MKKDTNILAKELGNAVASKQDEEGSDDKALHEDPSRKPTPLAPLRASAQELQQGGTILNLAIIRPKLV